MTTPGQSQALQPVSIIDIVTFGYKGVLRCVWPITQLALPVLIVYAISTSVYFQVAMGMQGSKPGVTEAIIAVIAWLAMMVSSLGLLYAYYAIIRYIRDLFKAELQPGLAREEPNIFRYLIPDWSLLGCLGIALIWMGAFVPAMIVTLIGCLLLLVPGVAFFSFFYTGFGMLFAVYLNDHERGVFEAVSETWNLMKGQFWRTAALGFLAWFIYLILSAPLLIAQFGVGFMQSLSPTLIKAPWFAPTYGILMALTSWFATVVWHGGLVFMLYRFYYDLKARQRLAEPVSMNDWQNRGSSASQGQ